MSERGLWGCKRNHFKKLVDGVVWTDVLVVDENNSSAHRTFFDVLKSTLQCKIGKGLSTSK